MCWFDVLGEHCFYLFIDGCDCDVTMWHANGIRLNWITHFRRKLDKNRIHQIGNRKELHLSTVCSTQSIWTGTGDFLRVFFDVWTTKRSVGEESNQKTNPMPPKVEAHTRYDEGCVYACTRTGNECVSVRVLVSQINSLDNCLAHWMSACTSLTQTERDSEQTQHPYITHVIALLCDEVWEHTFSVEY